MIFFSPHDEKLFYTELRKENTKLMMSPHKNKGDYPVRKLVSLQENTRELHSSPPGSLLSII